MTDTGIKRSREVMHFLAKSTNEGQKNAILALVDLEPREMERLRGIVTGHSNEVIARRVKGYIDGHPASDPVRRALEARIALSPEEWAGVARLVG